MKSLYTENATASGTSGMPMPSAGTNNGTFTGSYRSDAAEWPTSSWIQEPHSIRVRSTRRSDSTFTGKGFAVAAGSCRRRRRHMSETGIVVDSGVGGSQTGTGGGVLGGCVLGSVTPPSLSELSSSCTSLTEKKPCVVVAGGVVALVVVVEGAVVAGGAASAGSCASRALGYTDASSILPDVQAPDALAAAPGGTGGCRFAALVSQSVLCSAAMRSAGMCSCKDFHQSST
mmetsp:Transcript_11017/g.28459  ORF Transcript_11017/g.28459 Transcript_11017/m.28459 type:complete len:230 (-) Transcript_11017:2386-3075(-)